MMMFTQVMDVITNFMIIYRDVEDVIINLLCDNWCDHDDVRSSGGRHYERVCAFRPSVGCS